MNKWFIGIGLLLIIGFVGAIGLYQVFTGQQFLNYNLNTHSFDLTSSFKKTNTDLIWNVQGVTATKYFNGNDWNGEVMTVSYGKEYRVPISLYLKCREEYTKTQCQNYIKNQVKDLAIADREIERERLKALQQEVNDLINAPANEWTDGNLGELN